MIIALTILLCIAFVLIIVLVGELADQRRRTQAAEAALRKLLAPVSAVSASDTYHATRWYGERVGA